MSSEVTYKSLDFLGFPLYRVGDDGSIWSWRYGRENWCRRWKRLRGKTQSGYCRVQLINKHTKRLYFAHQLVLMAFVGPCPGGMICRHLNGDPSDSCLSNICWGTYQENSDDMKRHGRAPRGEKSGKAKLTDKDVRWLRARYKYGDWPSQREFAHIHAKILGVGADNIRCIIRYQKHWPHIVV